MMKHVVFYYPIILTAIGVGIHFFGTLGVFQLEVPKAIHVALLIVDTLVVVGLLRRSHWGYYLAIALYMEQSIVQPYLAYTNNVLYQMVVTCPLVIAALVVLLVNKKIFIRSSKN